MIYMNKPVCGICGAPYDEERPDRPMIGFVLDSGEQLNMCFDCVCAVGAEHTGQIIVPGHGKKGRRKHDD